MTCSITRDKQNVIAVSYAETKYRKQLQKLRHRGQITTLMCATACSYVDVTRGSVESTIGCGRPT